MEPPADADPNLAATGEEDTPMVVDFHRDAYPWVAVLMLSDVSSAKSATVDAIGKIDH